MLVFILLNVFGVFFEVASTVTRLAIGKDWTIVIAASKRYAHGADLMDMNSMNRRLTSSISFSLIDRYRISLSAKILAPLFYGSLVTIYTSASEGNRVALIITAVCNAVFGSTAFLLYSSQSFPPNSC